MALPVIFVAALSVAGEAARGEAGDWAARVAEAAHLAESAQGVTARLAALSALIIAQEEGQATLRRQMGVLREVEAEARAALLATDADLAALLIALQRHTPGTAPLPMLHPHGAGAAVRSMILAQSALDGLTVERQELVSALATVQSANAAVKATAVELDALRSETSTTRQQLISATAAQAPLPPAFDSEAAAAWAMTIDARDVEGLVRGVVTSPSFETKAKGATPWSLPLDVQPVPYDNGWRLRAAPDALVRAPAAANILYSGPLRGYRIVQVLEVGAGRHLVIAGLGQALVRSGDQIDEGDLLGVLPDESSPELHRNVTRPALPTGSLPRDTLYMEGRYADRTVDLAQWFAVTKDE